MAAVLTIQVCSVKFFVKILLTGLLVTGAAQASTSGAYLAARFAQDHGDWEATHSYIKEIMKDGSLGDAVQRRALIVAIAAEDYEQADKLAEGVAETEEDKTLPLFYQAIRQIYKNNNAEAISLLNKIPDGGLADVSRPLLMAWLQPTGITAAPRKDNNILLVYHGLLKAEMEGGKEDIAALVTLLPERWPLSTRAKNRLAALLIRNGHLDIAKKYDEALSDISHQNYLLATFKPVMSLRHGVGYALFDVASMLYNEKGTESTYVFLKLALMVEENIPEAHLLLATIETQRGRADTAIRELQAISSTYGATEFVDIQRNIANLMLDAGAEREGVKLLKGLIAAENDIDSIINLGDYYRNKERYKESLQYYEAAFKHFLGIVPDDYWYLHYYRGMMLERLGQWSRAEKDLLKALEYKPNDPQILNYIGYSWADQNLNLEKAVSYLQRAVQLSPDDGYILDSLGWVYYRTGDWEKAVMWLEKAVRSMPYDPTINDHLGDAYWKVGRKIEARFQWQRAIDNKPEADLRPLIESKLANGLAS